MAPLQRAGQPPARRGGSRADRTAGMTRQTTDTELTPALIDSLRRLDACRVANAIETFDCRLRNEGFADGVGVSHAFVHILEFGEPVTIGGLTVASNDIVFADVHGVLTIPSEIAAEVPRAAERMSEHERRVVELCQSADFTLERLRAA